MAPLELTRRGFVQGGLGAAGLALSAGCRGGGGPRYGGGLVGPAHQRGHLLRDGKLSAGEGSEDRPVSVAIVGAGVAGLSAAWALQRAGVEDFVLLELEDGAGGTSRSGEARLASGERLSAYPLGAHYLPVPGQQARALCTLLQELGILEGFDAAGRARCGEEHLCRAPQERIYYKGRWYEGLYLRAGASAEDLRQQERFHDEIGRWVRTRAFAVPRRYGAPGAAAELDQLTMGAYLDRLGLRSWRLRWHVDYGCRDDFGLRADEASAWAGMHYFAARLLHPDDHPPEVMTWPEGNGYLVQRLLARIGAERVRSGCLVSAVEPVSTAAPGPEDRARVRYLGPDGAPRSVRARRVIFALPTYLRRHLIGPLRSGAVDSGSLSRLRYAPWLVANLTLRRAPSVPVAGGAPPGERGRPGYPLCWDNVLVESPALGYVVATHQREPALPADRVPRTVFTYYWPLCGDPKRERQRLYDASWPALCEAILADLQRAEPGIRDEVERIDIYRWGHGMVRPEPGLISSGALEQAERPLSSLHFAHSDLSGLALFEEAQAQGVRAAQEVLAALGQPFEDLLG